MEELSARLAYHLSRIYPEAEVPRLVRELASRVEAAGGRTVVEAVEDLKWSEQDVMLITYGDSIRKHGEPCLKTLKRFYDRYLADTVSGLHILPFYPFSSDDGFSVIDYRAVREDLGTWDDVGDIARQSTLMADFVINHASVQHEWFQQFLKGQKPGVDYFITHPPETDVSEVVRPRPHRVLVPFETREGEKHVWATFSDDQVDLDFSNPDLFLEMVDVLLFYIAHGARWIRLDAVGFLWKELGTACIHLDETHEMIRLLRVVAEAVEPRAVLISETNVPNLENLSYFGNRNEAHAIYNFSLPPLLLDALLQGRSKHLNAWMMSMPPAPYGCTYFNFTASHDGIGLRPAEGLLEGEEIDLLVDTMRSFCGEVSERALADGTLAPYEINITLYDALKGTVEGEDPAQAQHQEQRFLCSQAVMLGLEGVPAVYIHSLLACPNDHQGVAKTGRKRSINRLRWDEETLNELLSDPSTPQARVLKALGRLIRIRRRQPAFHPNAAQYTLQLGDSLFGFWRQSPRREQSIFAVHNLRAEPQSLPLSSLNLVVTDPWMDLISGRSISDLGGTLELEPYQSVWLTNYQAPRY